MARRFELTETEMPTLRQVQWSVSSYSKKHLHHNDDYDEILGQIDQLAYGPTVSDTTPFSFGWEGDARGKPDVGNGSDEKPIFGGTDNEASSTECGPRPRVICVSYGRHVQVEPSRVSCLCLRDL
ncbi:hypothetical protein F444_18262 [Phytophthora nicotianae P1976]|uniref:Uncharacterized protein n=1 Tax=Phytophthora nicotianae P1976 TaxID=1317066 RepID=A0A080ZC07_PHYNI|nr:hypothetical protein F444_18262 [Phytophthora nicotianae P1976]